MTDTQPGLDLALPIAKIRGEPFTDMPADATTLETSATSEPSIINCVYAKTASTRSRASASGQCTASSSLPAVVAWTAIFVRLLSPSSDADISS